MASSACQTSNIDEETLEEDLEPNTAENSWRESLLVQHPSKFRYHFVQSLAVKNERPCRTLLCKVWLSQEILPDPTISFLGRESVVSLRQVGFVHEGSVLFGEAWWILMGSQFHDVSRVNIRDLAELRSEVTDGWFKLSAHSCERLNFAPNQVWNQRRSAWFVHQLVKPPDLSPVHWDDVLICVDYHATSIPHVATNLVSEERSPIRPLDHSSPKMGSTSAFALIPSHTFGPAGAVEMWALPECCLSSSGCLPGPSEDMPVVSGGQGNCIQIIQQWHCILWLFHTCSYIFHHGPFRCLP